MGSEMCIRDSFSGMIYFRVKLYAVGRLSHYLESCIGYFRGTCNDCLLYTSDAADERSSVDLGGRRIIKKKNNNDDACCGVYIEKKETRD